MISRHAFFSHLNVLLFGLSSWLLVNSVWVELALLVQTAPEGYALASHMAISLQAANIFPLLYSVLARWKDPPIPYHVSVGVILAMGIAACELLAEYWNHTAVVFGKERSAWLILLLFIGGALDCTSSVVYWPFVSLFDEPYTATLATGESLSGSLPALLAAWQIPLSGEPLFGPSPFFHVMTALMVLSTVAFALLFVPAWRPPPSASRCAALLETVTDDAGVSRSASSGGSEGPKSAQERDDGRCGQGEEESSGGEAAGGEGKQQQLRSGSLEALELDFAGALTGGEQGGSRREWARRDGSGHGPAGEAERAEPTYVEQWGDDKEWEELWLLCREPVLLEAWLKVVVDGVYPSLFPFACKGFDGAFRVLFVGGIVVSLAKPIGAHLATYPALRCRNVRLLTWVWTVQFAAIILLAFWSSGHFLASHGWLLITLVGSGGAWAGYTHAMLFMELGLKCNDSKLPAAARTASYRWAGQSTQAGALLGTVAAFVLVNFSGLFEY